MNLINKSSTHRRECSCCLREDSTRLRRRLKRRERQAFRKFLSKM